MHSTFQFDEESFLERKKVQRRSQLRLLFQPQLKMERVLEYGTWSVWLILNQVNLTRNDKILSGCHYFAL